MFLCIFITVILFGSIITYLTTQVLKAGIGSISKFVSSSIAQNINSDYFIKELGLKNIEEIDASSPKTKELIEKTYGLGILTSILPFINSKDMFNVNVELNDKIIYTNERSDTFAFYSNDPFVKKHINPSNSRLPSQLTYYNDTVSLYPLFNASGESVGMVTARINPQFIILAQLNLIMVVIIIAILSMLMGGILSRFFTMPIILPLIQLEKKFKAITSGHNEETMNTQIVLKRPLREIEALANSTNEIMHKMKEYSDLLESQKFELECQNEELEAQNEELFNSKYQIQQAQSQLVQSEKMASIGQLTAAIAHEINTPLGAIYSNVQLFEMILHSLNQYDTIKGDEGLAVSVKEMQEANDINIMACQRVIEIIKSLKNFSKLDEAEFQEADINEGIKSVLTLTSNLWKRRITLHQELNNVPKIKCFPGLLNQVFMNIIVNAFQAIEDKGEMFIKTYADEKYVYVSIKDTGTGIKEVNISKIFDPGFTTKGAGIGMGWGLSISYNILQKHHGEIKVSSKEGMGTEFIICIPLKNSTT